MSRVPCAGMVPEARSPALDEASLDEARFLAALRRSVEGAPTSAEIRLAGKDADWEARYGRICARYRG